MGLLSLVVYVSMFLHVNGAPQFVFPNSSSILSPGNFSTIFEDDGVSPLLGDLGPYIEIELYTGDKDQPVNLGAVFTGYPFDLTAVVDFTPTMCFNSTQNIFLALLTYFMTNSSIVLTTFSSRFSSTGFADLIDTGIALINSGVVGDPAPSPVYRCTYPALSTCAPSVALKGLADVSSSPTATAKNGFSQGGSESGMSETNTVTYIGLPSLSVKTSQIGATLRPFTTTSCTTSYTAATASSNLSQAYATISRMDLGLVVGLGTLAAIAIVALVGFSCRNRKQRYRRAPPSLTDSTTLELSTGQGLYQTAELEGAPLNFEDFTAMTPREVKFKQAEARILNVAEDLQMEPGWHMPAGGILRLVWTSNRRRKFLGSPMTTAQLQRRESRSRSPFSQCIPSETSC